MCVCYIYLLSRKFTNSWISSADIESKGLVRYHYIVVVERNGGCSEEEGGGTERVKEEGGGGEVRKV